MEIAKATGVSNSTIRNILNIRNGVSYTDVV